MKKFKDLKAGDMVFCIDENNHIRTKWIEGVIFPKLDLDEEKIKIMGIEELINVSPNVTSINIPELFKEFANNTLVFTSLKETEQYRDSCKDKYIKNLTYRALNIFRKLKRVEGLDSARKRLEDLLIMTNNIKGDDATSDKAS